MDTLLPVDYSRFPMNGWTFGQEFDLLLTRRGISRLKASAYIGVDHAHVSRLCNGGRNPTREMIKLIAGGLSLTPKEEARLMILAGFVPDNFKDPLLQQVEWMMFPIVSSEAK
jgi:transcriptional regulator with XRE-family HTH domain